MWQKNLQNFQKNASFPEKDAFFFFHQPKDILYLTNVKASFIWLLVRKAKIIIISDSRYKTALTNHFSNQKNIEVIILPEASEKLKNKRKSIYLPETISFQLEKSLKKHFLKAHFTIHPKNPLQKFRRIKNKTEIKRHQKAMAFTEKSLAEFFPLLKQGITETEASWKLEQILRENGQNQLAFLPIVAFGANSALPHHTPEKTSVLQPNVPILIDCGVVKNHYCSDITRMAVLGTPETDFVQAFNTVLKAQKATLSYIKPQKTYKDIVNFCRAGLGQFEPYFTHSLGHGVGLEVHENPRVSKKSKDTAAIGDVITIEPGVYMPNKWGIRIEDTGTVTNNGFENFCTSSKELIRL